MTHTNGDEALDPASMLALAQRQQKSVSSQRGSFVAIIMAGYGVALLVGFLSLRFVAAPLSWWIFVGLFAAAIVLSIVLGVLGGGLVFQGLENHLLLLFYSSVYTLLIGVQYFMAGVIWRGIPSLVVGGWLVIVAAVSPYLGYPNNYLLLGIAGGGAFIVLAIVTAMRTRAARLATNG